MEIPGKKGTNNSMTIVEIPDGTRVAGFTEYLKAKGLKVKADEPVFPVPITPDGDNHSRRLQQVTPWGINKVFIDYSDEEISKLPSGDDFPDPTEIVHKICIIDSGYQLGHPDLPIDATNADSSQGPNSENPFSFDGCNHGKYLLSFFTLLFAQG